jgi:hypothetical protein
MHGVTMKFVHQLDNKVLDTVDARCNHEANINVDCIFQVYMNIPSICSQMQLGPATQTIPCTLSRPRNMLYFYRSYFN